MSAGTLASRPLLPPAGPLLAKAFDRGIVLMLRCWPWLIFCGLVQYAVQGVTLASNTVGHAVNAFWVVVVLLAAANISGSRELRRIGFSAFWVALLIEIITILGFIALVIPGLYLGTRLWPALAILATERCSGSESLARSWALTSKLFWPTFILYGSILGILVASIVILISVRSGLLGVMALLSFKHVPTYTVTFVIQMTLSYYIAAAGIAAKLLWLPVLSQQASLGSVNLASSHVEASQTVDDVMIEPITPDHADSLFQSLARVSPNSDMQSGLLASPLTLRRHFEAIEVSRAVAWSTHVLAWAVREGRGGYVGYIEAVIRTDHTAGIKCISFGAPGLMHDACIIAIRELTHSKITVLDAAADVDDHDSVQLLESLCFKRTWVGPSSEKPGRTQARYSLNLGEVMQQSRPD